MPIQLHVTGRLLLETGITDPAPQRWFVIGMVEGASAGMGKHVRSIPKTVAILTNTESGSTPCRNAWLGGRRVGGGRGEGGGNKRAVSS